METDLDARFKELLTRVRGELKPLGWRKERQNFRLFLPDGLCRIISFQRNQYNTAENLEFIINLGAYFERGETVSNRRFKEYECPLRRRISRNPPGPERWWAIRADTDMDALFDEMREALERAQAWFRQWAPSKEAAMEAALNGQVPMVPYKTLRALVDMGYGDRIYEHIKDIQVPIYRALAEEIKG